MKNKHKILIRLSVFMMIFIMIFTMINAFFQPIWLDWNNYYTTHGFYKQPKNTIETIVLGPSTLITGITPMEMYEEYGICAYNLATEQQPLLASYYWLKEAERLHGDTLKTVILEVSALRSSTSDTLYHKSLDTMRLSVNKFQAVYDYCEEDLADTLSYLFPVVAYHNRWTELEAVDFNKNSIDPNSGTRGYGFETETYSGRVAYKNVKIKDIVCDDNVGYTKFRDDSLEYAEKIIDYCNEQGLELILVKTPTNNWSDTLHVSAQSFADNHNITFLDFNYSPLYEELGYIHAFDSKDGNHMNYYGATKLTKWMGSYLVKNCDATDIRGQAGYSFMEDELVEYNNRVKASIELKSAISLSDYIEIASKGENTILITVMDEAANNFTQEQRSKVLSAGLPKLSMIEYRDSYVAVIENGKTVYEAVKSAEDKDDSSLTYSAKTLDGKIYNLTSGGYNHGKTSSCLIDGTEYSDSTRGINIVVYNNVIEDVIDSVVFDTFSSCYRSTYDITEASLSIWEIMYGEFESTSYEGRMQEYHKKVLELRDSQLN